MAFCSRRRFSAGDVNDAAEESEVVFLVGVAGAEVDVAGGADGDVGRLLWFGCIGGDADRLLC